MRKHVAYRERCAARLPHIKNRDIWRCPSAKLPSYVGVVRAGPDWFQNLLSTGTCACEPAYPPGWGGTITDSANGPAGAGCTSFGDENTGATEIDYGARETSLAGKKLSTVDDASRYIAFGERGYKTDWTTIEHIAYPDVCRADKYAMYHSCNNEAPGWIEEYWSDPSTRKQYTRHLGGDNIAFLDGHAAWWAADAMIAGAGNWQNPHPQLHGTFCACDNTCPWFAAADGRLGD